MQMEGVLLDFPEISGNISIEIFPEISGECSYAPPLPSRQKRPRFDCAPDKLTGGAQYRQVFMG